MKKLFISQPMNGKTDDEIEATRLKAIESAKKKISDEVKVIDSFVAGQPWETKPLWYLGKALQMMSEADVVYFTKDWESARGCRIENTCAYEYDIPVIIEDDNE